MSTKGHYTKEERAKRVEWIVRLYKEHCIAEISRITGNCERFVVKALKERGVERRKTNPCKGRPMSLESQKRKELILSMIKQGVFYKDIARRLNVTLAYVSLVARENGIRMTQKEMTRRSLEHFDTRSVIMAERRRVLFGLPQKTKRRINLNPNKQKIYDLRVRMRKRGYILGENVLEVYFNDNTQRSERCERTAMRYRVEVSELKQSLKCV